MNQFIFIDLDNTLVDTQAFKKILRTSFVSMGISPELFDRTKHEANGDSWHAPYDMDAHLALLVKEVPDFDAIKNRPRFLQVYKEIKHFVFPDAKIFLKELESKAGLRRILLSFGEYDVQMIKVRSSRLDKYFDSIDIVQQHKINTFSKMPAEHLTQSVYINDNVKECLELHEQFPALKFIVRKTNVNYPPHPFPVVNNLLEIKSLWSEQ